MTPNEKRTKELMDKFGEDWSANTWVVPGGKVRAAYHACIERMAAQAGIAFGLPQIIDADPQNIVIVVTGSLPDGRTEWSFGECSPKNNKNAYGYSMAEKRGKDRVALKLLGFQGLLYSEEEAKEFRDAAPADATPAPPPPKTAPKLVTAPPPAEDERTSSQIMADDIIDALRLSKSPQSLARKWAHADLQRDYGLLDEPDQKRVDAVERELRTLFSATAPLLAG
jgi:hypothetical protein